MKPIPSAPGPTPGFRMGVSGLLLPHECPNARTRYVLTAEQEKKLRHAIEDVFAPASLRFSFQCSEPGCTDPRIERIPNPTGGLMLRCGCRDRVFSAASQVSTRPRR